MGYSRKGITYKVCHEEGTESVHIAGEKCSKRRNYDKEQQDFKGMKRTKNKTFQNLKHSLSQNNTGQNFKTSTKVPARLLKFDDSVFLQNHSTPL